MILFVFLIAPCVWNPYTPLWTKSIEDFNEKSRLVFLSCISDVPHFQYIKIVFVDQDLFGMFVELSIKGISVRNIWGVLCGCYLISDTGGEWWILPSKYTKSKTIRGVSFTRVGRRKSMMCRMDIWCFAFVCECFRNLGYYLLCTKNRLVIKFLE